MSDELKILDAAYRLDGDTGEWLSELLEVLGPISPAVGILACEVEAARDGTRVDLASHRLWGEIAEESIPFAQHVHRMYPPEVVAHAYTAPDCTRVSEVLRESGVDDAWTQAHLRWMEATTRTSDGWRLVGGNPDGRAVLFAGALTPGTPVHRPAERLRWRKIAAHVAAAHRLRRALAGERLPLDEAEAVFETDGRAQHLSGEARSRRAVLREAVTLHRRCRSRALAPREALDAWTALLDGRWSIVERIDTDGRRLIVAHANEAPVPGARTLSARERQVVEYAAHGHPNGFIAYELGLAETTVGSYLHAALRKLGFASRGELIRARQAIAAAARERRGDPRG